MIKTELFYKLAVADMEAELDTRSLKDIVVKTEEMVNGKNLVDFKYKGAIDVSVFLPQKGFGVGHYQVKIRGEHEKGVCQALYDFMKISGYPDFTRGSDSLVKKVLESEEPRRKTLKVVMPRIREVVDI